MNLLLNYVLIYINKFDLLKNVISSMVMVKVNYFMDFVSLSNIHHSIPSSADASVGMSVVYIRQPVKIYQITYTYRLTKLQFAELHPIC